MQPRHEVADVLHRFGSKIETIGLNTWQLRTISALKKCRTSALGGHIDACNECGNLSISYNGCRNRHCPKCQGKNREDWIQAREAELLPVPYFHVVFTLPEALNTSAMHQPKAVYDILFDAAWHTLHTFGKNKGVKMGMIAVLHTWGQQLSLHPHLHCIVPGGGINKNGEWQNIRADGKFLFPVKALSKVFRAEFCKHLQAKLPEDYRKIREQLWQKSWVVYAKRPFGSPKSVVEYLGRYTHKIAISNHRIKAIEANTVSFEYKDYKAKGQKKTMLLTHEEFIRRFSLHILPKRFVKIRHFGFLSSTWKRNKLKKLQKKFKIETQERPLKKAALAKCPCCKAGNLITILLFDKRGPPDNYLGVRQNLVSCKS